MTHSGGKPHAVGDHGQRYEVHYSDAGSADKRTFGWSSGLDGCARMVKSIELHPAMHSPEVLDRESGELVPLETVKENP